MERITISLGADLARQLDHWLAERAYTHRSEAIRDMIRGELERTRQQDPDLAPRCDCWGVLSYVFDRRYRELGERLVGLEHVHQDHVVSSLHAPLDAERSIEAVVVRGGVHHGRLNLVSARNGR